MKTVIIGGVAGGATAAARLRRLDEKMEIVVLERGGYISYANCGLPYYVGDVITMRENLLLQTPELMKERFNIDVRVRNEVTRINPQEKTVTVTSDKGEYEESYDELIIATGSSPLTPPIEGINTQGIYTLWNVDDVDKIRSVVDEAKPKTAAVIGGGFIGLEMAENLHARGITVSIIEAQNQVMAPVDYEMASILHEHLDVSGVSLYLNNGVKSFERENDKVKINLTDTSVFADMVILAIGVRPNSSLAIEAGIKVNERKGIVVDSMMKTSEPHIWACGDVVEVDHLVTGTKTMIPLAGPANKQARIVADNICGASKHYKGSMGTSVAKVFDLTVASTGINEKTLQAQGKKKHIDYETALISAKSHAGYYPMATQMFLKLNFTQSGKILGAQIVGQDGVDKRIDTIATTISNGGTVDALMDLELSYAPPFSSAKDPVNMLGFVAENIRKGLVKFSTKDELEGKVILDVTEDVERDVFSIPNSIHIPLGQLRRRIGELDKNKEIVVYCAIGVRAYNAARILSQNGFEKVSVLEGGISLYKSLIHNINPQGTNKMKQVHAESKVEPLTHSSNIEILDCCGMQCPGPIMKVNNALSNMKAGDILRVCATDMGFARDVESWCARTGNTYMGMEKKDMQTIVTIQKGSTSQNAQGVLSQNSCNQNTAQDKTIIVFDGDMDKVMASLIIANGAASMGRKVTMFYTFWGLNALRKTKKVSVKKSFIEKMFGAMMPRGLTKLKLSKMNMGGMGKRMMEMVMKKKHVSSLEELMQQAMAQGVKMIACTMSMDVMGIKKEELIDGVELAGVATYLGEAENANVNLFV